VTTHFTDTSLPVRVCTGFLVYARAVRRRVVRWARLSRNEHRLWLRALGLLALVRIRLSLVPFDCLSQSVRDVPLGGPADNSVPVGQLVWAIRSASRLVPRATCLTQALAGQILLRRHGYPAEVHIGVTKDAAQGFQAHAWLEHQGQIVLGQLPDQARYTCLSRGPIVAPQDTPLSRTYHTVGRGEHYEQISKRRCDSVDPLWLWRPASSRVRNPFRWLSAGRRQRIWRNPPRFHFLKALAAPHK